MDDTAPQGDRAGDVGASAPGVGAADKARLAKRAEALRANLRRRKAQSRGRAAAMGEMKADEPEA